MTLDVLNNLIFTEERRFNHDRVIQLCDHILSFTEPEYSVLSAKGKAYERLGNYKEALKLYELTLQLDGLDEVEMSMTFIELGYIHSLMKEFLQAKTYFEKALHYDDDPFTYHHLAWTEANLGNREKSLELVEKAIALESDNSYAYKVRAKIHLMNHHNEAAVKDLQNAKALGYDIEYGQEVNDLLLKLGSK